MGDINAELSDGSIRVHAPPPEPIQYENLEKDESSESYELLNLDR